MDTDGQLLYREKTQRILDAFHEVHRAFQYHFAEPVYRRAMVVALEQLGAHCDQERTFRVVYREVIVGEYRADLVVDNAIIVEIKRAESLHRAHVQQCYNYLHVSGLRLGLVLNFGPKAEFKRCFVRA
ncbi:MAG: GxxExxY protein [Gemmatimonas sp.]